MRGHAGSRALAAATAFGLAWLKAREASSAQPSLLVFVHTAVKQRALQDALSSSLPGISVTAVGRVGDFQRQLEQRPDAVLSLPVVLESAGLSASLRGKRGGDAGERYVLVAANKTPHPSSLGSVGALDILGRSGTSSFVSGLLGASPRVVRVTKLEDLLPLLQMQRADAILLPARLKAALATASRLALVEHELTARVGLPAVAVLGAGGAAVVTAMRRLSSATSNLVGVDSWH